MAKRYNPLAPDPHPQRSARKYVNALVNPLMKAVESQFDRQLQGGGQLISGYTDKLRADLAPLAGQTQARYSAADSQLAAIDNALANRLTAAGRGVGGDVNAKLAQAGIGGSAPDLAQMGAGASAAGFARGSASRSALVAQGAAASDYASKLPGIAGLGGLRALQNLGAQTNQQRSTAEENLRSKIPGMYQQAYQDISNQNLQKATAQLGFAGTTAKLASDAAQFNATQQYRYDSLGAKQQQKSQAAVEKRTKAKQSAVGTATTKAKSILDAATKPVAGAGAGSGAGGNIFIPSPGGSAGTPKARQANYYGTLKKVVGVVRPLLSPYMTNAQIIRFAQGIANSYYAPGQYGRPGRGVRPSQGIPGTAGRGPGGTGPR